MTEYDYSPEAFEAYIQKQQKISRWVDHTRDHRRELRNPFTPATPAVQYAKELQHTDDSGDESERPHRHTKRRDSKDEYRDRRRDKERDRELQKDWVRVEREREKVKDHHFSRRHRSSSVDATTARPYKQPPPPLPIPAYPMYPSYPQQHYPPKLTSPRNSHHSSRTSATLLQPSPTYIPYSAPVYYNTQSYPYPPDSKYPYSSSPYYQSGGYSSVKTVPVLFILDLITSLYRMYRHTRMQPTRQNLLFSSASL